MLNIGYVYDLPFFKTGGLSHTLLGGWQLSGIISSQSGAPFSAVNSANYSDNAGVGNTVGTGSYPDVVSNPKSGIPSATLEGYGPLVANPGAFVAPRGLTFGNAGRNSLRNPSYTNFNMAVFKRFAVNERAAFEFRAEAFNIFNQTQWAPISGEGGSAAYNGVSSGTNSFSCYGGPNNSAGDTNCVGSADFLRVGAAHAARILQLGLKFTF